TTKLVNTVILELETSTPPKATIILNPLLPVYADYALVTQVWINLISNAIKYSAKKESPKIEIGSIQHENEIVHYVKDNGVGFDTAYADKLFGVFQRLHKASDFDGNGVGLAIVKRIISKHGGRVWAESKPNEGASFYFSLPGVPRVSLESAHLESLVPSF
ncbi:MAG TPA: ATP-binding protein, partial [Cyclobacteriaceae bacterium]|nr:ATP-binding protein [Cyclobacteriaceae bacterium]